MKFKKTYILFHHSPPIIKKSTEHKPELWRFCSFPTHARLIRRYLQSITCLKNSWRPIQFLLKEGPLLGAIKVQINVVRNTMTASGGSKFRL